MPDLSSILPTMPTYFGAQLPASPPASGTSPIMDALRTVSAVKPSVPQNPYSLVPAAPGPPANPQSHFGAVLPTMSSPAARVAAPAAPVASGGASPPAAGSEWAAAPMSPESAAPNVIQGGVPGATMPSEVPGMLHPADHAIAYEQHLARQRSVQPFNGTNGDQFTTLGPDTPGPGPAAAINVIRGGIPSESGGGRGGMNLMQFEAVKPLIEARMQAQQLNPAMTIPNELMAMAKYRRDQRIASKEDPTKVMADYEGELYRIHNQTLALIQALSPH